MAVCFASQGYNVIGVDINQQAVNALDNGQAPAQEKGLEALTSANQERLRATLSAEDAVLNSEISFVIVPTPSDHRGAFTLQYAKQAFCEFGLDSFPQGRLPRYRDEQYRAAWKHTFRAVAILEEESGKLCGEDFGLCYNPEFIALGSVIHDFLNPDFYLLGQFDDRSGDMLNSVHQRVSQNKAPVKRMSLENAELAKIAVNSFVTMKISYANMLAEFCEKIPGGDVHVVSDALGMDQRIGRKYLTGGFGFGGPCFPRDNMALDFIGQSLGVDSRLLETNDKYNRNLPSKHVGQICKFLPDGATVAVLGLSYKPDTHVIEESPGIYLCQELGNAGFRVIGHDTLAASESEPVLRYKALVTNSLDEALINAQAIIVTTRDPLYLELTTKQITRNRNKTIFFDFWRCFKHLIGEKRIEYVPIGLCRDERKAEVQIKRLWE